MNNTWLDRERLLIAAAHRAVAMVRHIADPAPVFPKAETPYAAYAAVKGSREAAYYAADARRHLAAAKAARKGDQYHRATVVAAACERAIAAARAARLA